MKRTLTCGLTVLLLTVASAQGAPVTPEAALEAARRFENQALQRGIMRAPANAATLTPAYQYTDAATSANALYVFNRGNSDGYVFVSGDDRAPLILGYTDKGHFDAERIPSNMQAMIENWSNQISWLASHQDIQAFVPTPTKAISPLLGDIMWDQGDPYNRKCPTVTQADSWGSSAGKGPAATGCVATALGQIMYYHKWPLQGIGNISYVSRGETPDGSSENVNVTASFGETVYDWDAMLPSLTPQSPANSIEAVSTLLFHAGAAFESVYGASTGATDVAVAPAMMKYFNYDKGINYLKRDFHTSQEWDEILLNELDNGRPVAYGGVTRKREGHFFVIDGVNESGYYHLNWGWSGMEDGYYLLTLLEPGAQGIGGASGGAFSYAQNMITGIRRPEEGSQLNYNFTCEGVGTLNKTVGRQETVTISATSIWNDSPNKVTANLGFILTDSDGKTVHRQMIKNSVEYDVAYGESKISCSFMIPDNIPAGNYTLRPVYQISDDDYSTDRLMQVQPGRLSAYNVTITDDNIAYASQGSYSLSMIDVKGDNEGDLENGKTQKITVTVHNDGGEFYGPVQLRLFINGKDRTFGRNDFPSSSQKALWVAIPAHSDTELTFDVGKFDLPGHSDYVVRLWGNEGTFEVDSDGYTSLRSAKNLCSKNGIKVVGPALPPVVEVVDDMIVTTAVNGVVPRNDIGLKVCISNEGGEWTGNLRCAVWDPDIYYTRDPLGYVTFTNKVTLEGETDEQWITLTGGEMPSNCETGKTYELTIQEPEKNEAMVPAYYVTTEVTLGEAVDKSSILSLDGITFSPENIIAGQPTDVQFNVSNTGYPYRSEVYFTVAQNGETVHTSARRIAEVDRDDEALIEFTETFELPTASDYSVTLYDDADKAIGVRENITFTADEPALSLTDKTVVPTEINANQPTDFVFGVENAGFRFDSTLRFVIVYDDDEKFASEPQNVTLGRNEKTVVSFNETINLANGTNYTVRLLAGDQTVGERTGITINNNNAVNEISDNNLNVELNQHEIGITGADAKTISVYYADGRLAASVAASNRLNISNLGYGTYILRIETADSVKTMKFIK